MNTLICAASMLLAATVSALAQGSSGAVSPDVLKDLAPTGKLRAAINLGNGVLAQPDGAGGQPKGITPDLAMELGTDVASVELVGLLPRRELDRCADDFLAWSRIDADAAIEARIGHGPRWWPGDPLPDGG